MGLFGKGSGDAPPDIGQEEKYDEEKGLSDANDETSDKGGESLSESKTGVKVPANLEREKPVASSGGEVVGNVQVSGGAGLGGMQIESINARIDSVVEWIKQFYERFSYVSESIGEIRTMTMNNEKRISEAMKEADKVIDVVKEVKPEELRINYQKADMKMTTLAEKIEANKLFMDEVMNEMNDLRRKSEVFVGTEGLMKLNEDTKKDLIEMQKINSRTRMQADKAQEIFMELRKGFADSQKVGAIVENLDNSYAGLKEEIERLKMDYGKIVKRSDFLDFKKTYGNKLVLYDSSVSDISKIKQNLSEIGDLIETSLAVSRRNEEDIGQLGMKVGAGDVKKVSDYENQMIEIVSIIETFSKQLVEIKKKLGMRTSSGEAEGREQNVENKKMERPSDAAKEKVAGVKVAEVPKLKPEEFLGKKNLIARRGEVDIENVEKKIAGEKKVVEENEPQAEADSEKKDEVKVEKVKGKIGSMIDRIRTRIKSDEKIKKGEDSKKRNKKRAKKIKPRTLRTGANSGKKHKKKGKK